MKNNEYKPQGRVGLFDEQMRLEQLAAKSNPLKQLSAVIDFEMFRDTLEDAVLTKEKRNNAGAKPYDFVMLFKILVLQRYFGLSDEHVFGFMEQSMHGIKCECVGIARATGIIGLMNLTYNLFRYEQIIRLKLLKVKY